MALMPPTAMATMLDLPREIYLMVCSDLTTHDLKRLAGVSRDHYLAVQQPLFSRIRITSFGALVKLVGTLTRAPVVSQISPKQRRLWHKLSDSQLRERDIRQIDLILDCNTDVLRITGAVLSRLVSAISRKCDGVKISLTLQGLSDKLVKELNSVELPSVDKLWMFLGSGSEEVGLSNRHRRSDSEDASKAEVWIFGFSGSTFPDLRTIYMNTLVDRPSKLPTNMERQFRLAERARPRRSWNSSTISPSNQGSFYGLFSMKEITLELNTYLDTDILKSLFNSTIVPKNLTKLEIVNCPALHPIKDLEALAMLLQRGLQLLQFLKLHLTWHFDGHHGYETAYISKISSNPEHHLCNIVRELGQKIKGLDLAVPYACDHLFAPLSKSKHNLVQISEQELPDVPEAPVNTLPQRLMAAGYRYRRLVFFGYCRGIDKWEEMESLARTQGDQISWELLHDGEGEDSKAVWLVSGCAPVEFSVQATMEHPFDET